MVFLFDGHARGDDDDEDLRERLIGFYGGVFAVYSYREDIISCIFIYICES